MQWATNHEHSLISLILDWQYLFELDQVLLVHHASPVLHCFTFILQTYLHLAMNLHYRL